MWELRTTNGLTLFKQEISMRLIFKQGFRKLQPNEWFLFEIQTPNN